MRQIDAATVDRALTWPAIVQALREGHRLAKPQLDDILLKRGPDGMLCRAAWIDGLGCCVKAMTVVPGNSELSPALPTIHGQLLLYDDRTGVVVASIDGVAVTRWKTAGDSALGAEMLARPDVESLLMVGAGTMAEPLIRAHVAVRPNLKAITIWNRSKPRAEGVAARLADLGRPVAVVDQLETAVRNADLISVATLSVEPIIHGGWLKPGAHLDLVGAFRNDMREADDEAMRQGQIFVDYRGTTIGHIGEMTIPLAEGVIKESDILGDHYDLVAGTAGRGSSGEITVFKNGGGAHLDLMTARAIVAAMAGLA